MLSKQSLIYAPGRHTESPVLEQTCYITNPKLIDVQYHTTLKDSQVHVNDSIVSPPDSKAECLLAFYVC